MATRPDLGRAIGARAGAMADAAAHKLSLSPAQVDGAVVRLDMPMPLPTPGPEKRGAAAPGAAVPPRPRSVAANIDRFSGPEFSASVIIPIVPDLSPESAPVPPEPKISAPVAAASKPVAPEVRVGSATSPAHATDAAAPVHNRVAVADQRLKGMLTPEMARHFGLIVYVSKASRGPLAQRMLVFENDNGELKPVHDWPASTGREQDEISPRGRKSFTATPRGFYELDPARMYLRYHSWSWDQDMPHAMFFNWERRGIKTGLAIHAAIGKDIAKLGSRASAGCVHLAPDHAHQLYRLVRDKYRGTVPRFSYNAASRTMTNSGTFMRDGRGGLAMDDGYRVLVMIDDFSGESRLADLD